MFLNDNLGGQKAIDWIAENVASMMHERAFQPPMDVVDQTIEEFQEDTGDENNAGLFEKEVPLACYEL